MVSEVSAGQTSEATSILTSGSWDLLDPSSLTSLGVDDFGPEPLHQATPGISPLGPVWASFWCGSWVLRNKYLRREEVGAPTFLRLRPWNYHRITSIIFKSNILRPDLMEGDMESMLNGKNVKEFGDRILKLLLERCGSSKFLAPLLLPF